ncbi:hypothetical protein ACJJIE_11945 [Microbulbifer sp. TRSA001]|uniref:hypothetical protein n=1 Tax=Microbulbifer sp. TRSA001 TaxID=3243381 RepID=UPI00403A2389
MKAKIFMFAFLLVSDGALAIATIQIKSFSASQRIDSQPEHVEIISKAEVSSTVPHITATFGYDFSCPGIISGELREEVSVSQSFVRFLPIEYSNVGQDISGYPTWSGGSNNTSCLLNAKWTAKNAYGVGVTFAGVGVDFQVNLPDDVKSANQSSASF